MQQTPSVAISASLCAVRVNNIRKGIQKKVISFREASNMAGGYLHGYQASFRGPCNHENPALSHPRPYSGLSLIANTLMYIPSALVSTFLNIVAVGLFHIHPSHPDFHAICVVAHMSVVVSNASLCRMRRCVECVAVSNASSFLSLDFVHEWVVVIGLSCLPSCWLTMIPETRPSIVDF